MTHERGNYYCLVIHFDKDGNRLPQCIQCPKCGKWIRPENMDDDCPNNKYFPKDKPEEDIMTQGIMTDKWIFYG